MINPVNMWGLGSRRIELESDRYILHVDRVASTMDTARKLLSKGDRQVLAVAAGFQTKGRGRRGGAWVAPPDSCLLITYFLPPTPSATFDAQQISFAAGVAVAQAITSATDGEITPKLKWPNDVIVGNKKIAGVLIEIATGVEPDQIVPLVGIGINVNVPEFPADIADVATSIELETGLLCDVNSLEEIVRKNLLMLAEEGWQEVLSLWRSYDATTGIRYTMDHEGNRVEGIAVGISDSGALQLRVGDTILETVAATSSAG